MGGEEGGRTWPLARYASGVLLPTSATAVALTMAPPQRPPRFHSSPSSLPPPLVPSPPKSPLVPPPPTLPSNPSLPTLPSHPSPPLLSRLSPPDLSPLVPAPSLLSLLSLRACGWSSMARPPRLHTCMCAMRLRTLSARSVRRTCGGLFCSPRGVRPLPMAYTIAARLVPGDGCVIMRRTLMCGLLLGFFSAGWMNSGLRVPRTDGGDGGV